MISISYIALFQNIQRHNGKHNTHISNYTMISNAYFNLYAMISVQKIGLLQLILYIYVKLMYLNSVQFNSIQCRMQMGYIGLCQTH